MEAAGEVCGWRRLSHFDVEESKLLANGQVFEHIVLSKHFERESEDGSQEQAFAHRTGSDEGLRRKNSEVGVQVVHALAQNKLHRLLTEDFSRVLRKDEHLRQLPVLLEIVEGPQQVSMAYEQLVRISTIRAAYIKQNKEVRHLRDT